MGGGGEVIWITSKSKAVFPQDTFPYWAVFWVSGKLFHIWPHTHNSDCWNWFYVLLSSCNTFLMSTCQRSLFSKEKRHYFFLVDNLGQDYLKYMSRKVYFMLEIMIELTNWDVNMINLIFQNSKDIDCGRKKSLYRMYFIFWNKEIKNIVPLFARNSH